MGISGICCNKIRMIIGRLFPGRKRADRPQQSGVIFEETKNDTSAGSFSSREQSAIYHPHFVTKNI